MTGSFFLQIKLCQDLKPLLSYSALRVIGVSYNLCASYLVERPLILKVY